MNEPDIALHENTTFDFPIIASDTDDALAELHARARPDYRAWKREFLVWCVTAGKSPAKHDGLAHSTTRKTSYKTGQIMRWLWDKRGYTTDLSPDDATTLMEEIARYGGYDDSNLNNFIKTIKRIFTFYNHERGRDIDWECAIETSEPKVTNRDFFRAEEFTRLHEAGLKYGTVKHYNQCTPDERSHLKRVLARRYDKPASDVTPADFQRANCFKIPSLVDTSIDLGLRPIEVARATPNWVNLDTGVIRIPADESTKNRDNWECVLSQNAIRNLDHWLDERESYEEYADTDALWLNAKRNRYTSKSLNYLLRQLIDETTITPAGRTLTWYSIRHGTATLWATQEDPHDARDQLRHKNVKTTLEYAHSSVDKRNGAADTKY